MIWLALALLLVASSVVLWLLSKPSESDIVLENLRAMVGTRAPVAPDRIEGLAIPRPLGKFKARDKEEVASLMAQAGWGEGAAALRFKLASTLAPVVFGVGAGMFGLLQGSDMLKAIQIGGVFAILGFLAPRRYLRMVAARRMQKMRLEVPQFALLLRMLLDTGMTLEHTMHIIVSQADRVIPVIAAELMPVVRRMNAGQDMHEALQVFRTVFGQAELHDIFLMLRQASEQGGNVRDSITAYVEDMETRLLAQLREYVSKLSGKMSLVMMLLLFPALLIIVAGPAMLAMVRGLSGL